MPEPVRPTRRELLRLLATVGAVTASGTLLDACGTSTRPAASTTPAATPAAAHPGALIMIIRHGEKPGALGDDEGVDPDGKSDNHALTARGWDRARALVPLFAPASGQLHPGLARHTAIYASGGNHKQGERTRQTVTPLATQLGITLNTQYSKGQEATMAQEVARRTEPTLICWQHGELPAIAAAIPNVTPAAPTHWPGSRFDLIWSLTPAAGGWAFQQIPEMIMAGDSNQSIA
ncbi:MAG TPA: hypothetical protein VH008_14755 [Pseudonocardia sp.]|nr:hypothetical protein [Pseudonocardia sp.]